MRAAVERADEVVGERLDRRVADGQPVAVVGDVVGDRVQQVRLAEPGRAADEERVVGEAGHLGDGERGGVGEPVGVADHELVEREARVELAARGARCGARAARRAAPRSRARRARRARPGRARASAQACEQPARSGLDPGADRRRAPRRRASSPSSSRRAERLEPDAARSSRRPPAAARRGCGARMVARSASDTGARKDLLGGAEARRWTWREGPRTARSANIAKASGPDRAAFRSGLANRARMSPRTGLCTAVDGVCAGVCASAACILCRRRAARRLGAAPSPRTAGPRPRSPRT